MNPKDEQPVTMDAGGYAMQYFAATILQAFGHYITTAYKNDPNIIMNGNFNKILEQFSMAQTSAFATIYQNAWHDISRTYRYMHEGDEKYLVIERLLFKRLEPILVVDANMAVHGQYIPTFIKDGLYQAIPMLIGETLYNNITERGIGLIKNFEARNPSKLAWDHVSSLDDFRWLIDKTLVEMAPNMMLFNKRAMWLQGLIDANMNADIIAVMPKPWRLDIQDYALLVAHIYKPLFNALDDRLEYDKFLEQFGQPAFERIRQLRAQLEQHRF